MGNPPYKAVNLGNWLLAEGWMKPSLFEGIVNKDLLDGTQVQFKSTKFQKYLCAEDGGGTAIVANRGSPSGWETFKLWRVNDSSFNFRVFNKKFVGLNNIGGGNTIVSFSDSPGNRETFQIIRNNDDPLKIRIKASNGLFLQAQSETLVTANYQGTNWEESDPSVFKMTIVRTLEGEYQLTNGYGPDRAPQVLREHWNSYITEDDFRFMSQNGLDAVRIPVGWWIAYDPNPPKPFVGGSLAALDNAFTWAQNHEMKVIVDLHAVEGSQNGNEHSGTRDGYTEWGDSYIPQTVAVIDFLAQRYGNKPSLGGIELMNEPQGVNLDSLKKYYKAAYDAVRKYNPEAYVIMSNPLDGDSKALLSFVSGFNKVVLDVHYYNMFWEKFNGMNVQQNIDFIRNERASDLAGVSSTNALTFIGEWTGEWTIQNASKQDFQNFAQAQLDVYSRTTFGWAYWSYKCQFNRWSLKWMIEQKADDETHVTVNNDEMKNSKDDVCISAQLKRPMPPSSGEPLVDIPGITKSSAELNQNYKCKLRTFKAMKQSSTLNQGMEQSSTLNQAKNQKTMMTTIDNAGRSILKHDQRKQQSSTAGRSIQVAGSSQMQHSTSKQAKNQKTLTTTIENAVKSILMHDQRKQQSLTAGSSIQVAGSAQIQHKKQDHRPVGRSLLGGLSSSSSAQFQKDLVDHGSSKKQKTTPKITSVSLDHFKRNKQQHEVEDEFNYENDVDVGDGEDDINYENDDGENTNDPPMKVTRKSKDDVYISSQLKRSMLPSSGELLEDIPESIKWMFSKGSFSKQGMEQSSTSKQSKNQKTRMSTIDPASRSILNHDQRKQCSTSQQAKNKKTKMSAIDSAVRSILMHEQRKQRSTLNQAQIQKTTMRAIDSAVRSILMHDLRKQQSLTAGSSIHVAGSAQMQHKKQDHRPAGRSHFVGLSNSSAQFQEDLVDHGPSKRQKKLPSMSLDDYFKMNNLSLEVEGDINSESDNGDVEGDINYENDDGEKTNDNPMEGEASKKRKRGRGRTLCSRIHDRSLAEREGIILNEEGEPIGPTQKIVSEFSNFLGSVARMSDLCPLTYTNWKAIPKKKENIWAYVNKRYIVPEKGEKAVYAIINDAWRRYKCVIKRNHFTKYDNLRERMKNRPDNIPEADFRKLMNYWEIKTIQEIGRQNAKITAQQKCRHRAGPISFAIIREKLRATKDDCEPPTQAEVFIETRQSKKGNQLDQVTSNTITNLQDLIVNSGQSSDEAFRTIFGKEKPGRVRCHGRVTTPSLLKRSKEIGEIKKMHSIEVKNLSDKIQEMEVKHEKMEKKHSKEMAAMEGKLQVLLRFMLNQSNSDQDMGDLAALLSTPNEDNNGLHSSTSAHGLNNLEVNHGLEEQLSDDFEDDDEEQPFDDLEDDNEEQPFDDFEDDEEQPFDDLEEDDEDQSFHDWEEDEEYSD